MADAPLMFRIHPERMEQDLINRAGETIENGGTVVFPAQYLYGIAGDPFQKETVERIFQIKKRSYQKPLLLLIKNRNQLESLVTSIPEAAEKLMNRFWPGNVTLVFSASDRVPDRVTAGTGKIGIRMPLHPVARALVERLDTPITGTSANIAGEPGSGRVEGIDSSFLEKTDLVLNAGGLKQGKGSTIVDITSTPARVIRQGEVPAGKIFQSLTE